MASTLQPKHVVHIPTHPTALSMEKTESNKGKSSHLTAGYTLDSIKAMTQKLEATKRPLSVLPKIKSGNITMKLNTAVYELVKSSFANHVSSSGSSVTLKNTEQDSKGNHTRTVLSVSGPEAEYSISMFHTTSTLLVNGQNPEGSLQHLKSLVSWWGDHGYNQESVALLSQAIARQTDLWLSSHKPCIDETNSGNKKCPKCKKNMRSQTMFCLQGQVWVHKYCAKMSDVTDGSSVPRCLVCQACTSSVGPYVNTAQQDDVETASMLVPSRSMGSSGNLGGTGTTNPLTILNGQGSMSNVTAISTKPNQPSHVLYSKVGQMSKLVPPSLSADHISTVTSSSSAIQGPLVSSKVTSQASVIPLSQAISVPSPQATIGPNQIQEDEIFEDASSDIPGPISPSATPSNSLYNFRDQLPSAPGPQDSPNLPLMADGPDSQPEAEFSCPTCGLPAQDGTIECSTCGKWLHFACAGVQDEAQIPEDVPYTCPGCQILNMFPEDGNSGTQSVNSSHQRPQQSSKLHPKPSKLSNNTDSTVKFLQNQLKAQSKQLLNMESAMKDKIKEKEDIVNQLIDRIQVLESEVRSNSGVPGPAAGAQHTPMGTYPRYSQFPTQSYPQTSHPSPPTHAPSSYPPQPHFPPTHPMYPTHPPTYPPTHPTYPTHPPAYPPTFPPNYPHPAYPPYPMYPPYPYYPPPPQPTAQPIVVPIVVSVPQVPPIQTFPFAQAQSMFSYRQPQSQRYYKSNGNQQVPYTPKPSSQTTPNPKPSVPTPTPPTPTPPNPNPPTPTHTSPNASAPDPTTPANSAKVPNQCPSVAATTATATTVSAMANPLPPSADDSARSFLTPASLKKSPDKTAKPTSD